MRYPRCLLQSFVLLQWLHGCHARQANLREGYINCDESHGSGCRESPHPHEKDGVLLLPESGNRWKAFNVHTLLLPQHEVAVSEHLARSRVASKILLLAKSGMAGVVLWFLVFICLGYMLVNMLGGSSSEKQDVEPLPSRLTEGSGSWAQAYREAQG